MVLMKNISHQRRQLERVLKSQTSNLLWFLCGLVTLPILGVLSFLVLKLPDTVIGVLIPLLSLTVLIESVTLIFLLDKNNQYKRYFKENHINLNLDDHYEAIDSFNEDDEEKNS